MMENNAYSGVDSELLPNGWERCTISDIVEVNPKKTVADADLLSGFVPMSHAPTAFNGPLKFDEKPWGEIKKSYTNFKDGDVIFAKVTPCFENGKAAIVRDLPNGIGAGSSEFYVLRPYSEEISEKFVFSLIKSHEFLQQGAENMTGAVGLRRVPRAFVESFPVNLPPLAEQKVIAETLDTLLAQVESIQTRLERVPHILKRFRQSVLAAAVSGKLTEEWRTQNGVTWSYKEKAISDLGKIVTGNTPSKKKASYYGGEFPMFKPSNLDAGYHVMDGDEFLTVEGKAASRVIPAKSTLVTCIGATIGKAGFTRVEGACNQQINVIIPNSNMVSEWVYFLIISPQTQGLIIENASSTTLPILNKTKFSELVVTVPPKIEQTEIVRRVEQLFAYADTIEQQVNQALARVNNLTQSILARAFSGELTRAWREANPELVSGDNSAEALLVRIQAERATQKKTKTKKGRKAATQ